MICAVYVGAFVDESENDSPVAARAVTAQKALSRLPKRPARRSVLGRRY
jgi:hypothetical protein